MVDINTVLKIKGKKYTIQEFMNKFGIQDEKKAINAASAMVKQGKISIVKHTTEEEEILAKTQEAEMINLIVDQIEAEEEASKIAKREQTKAESDLVSIQLVFDTTLKAQEAQTWLESIGILDSEISIKSGEISLKIIDITPQEYTKIARKYQTEKVLDKTVNVASKAIVGTTDAINYTATKVVAPVAKIAGEAGMNLGKGLVHTSVKIGAGLVNASSNAVRDTKVAMATDPEMLKAKGELTEAKNAVMRFIRGKLDKSKKRSGISFID